MTITQALRQSLDWIAELPEEDQPDEWASWKTALLEAETGMTVDGWDPKPHLCNQPLAGTNSLCALPKAHEGRCWVYVRGNPEAHANWLKHVEKARIQGVQR